MNSNSSNANQSAASTTTLGQNIPMPPPFFLPPFMAPCTIPPPPMPPNLDQLTIEELRAMEGNERTHIEERLKLLKNINTMINASAALMNQYQMIVANLPQIPIPTTSASSSESNTNNNSNNINNNKKDEEKSSPSTSTTEKVIDTNKIKVEDLGSEIHLDQPAKVSSLPSTSSSTLIEPASSSDASSSFIANETLNHSNINNSNSKSSEPDEANEIRKRRLQKFLQNN